MNFQAHFVRRKCGRGVTLSTDGATASANYFGPGSIGPDGDCRVVVCANGTRSNDANYFGPGSIGPAGDCRVVVCSNGTRSNDNPELETVRIAWQHQLENSDEIWYAILFFLLFFFQK
jgi:hypothetical protein